MQPFKKTLLIAALLSLSALGTAVHAQTETRPTPQNDALQDFHIDKDGYVSIRQAKIVQISGTSFYARYYVGLAFIRILIKTDKNTDVRRRFGDQIPLGLIETGDTINLEGKVENGADSLSVIASKIVDFSNQKEISSFKGSIVNTGGGAGTFMLASANRGTITITTGTTTQIRKGNRIISPDLVRVGDTVTDTVGTYDHANKTLDANVIVVYTDMNVYEPRNFEGTLKTISAGNPTMITFNTEGRDYSVPITNNIVILNKARKPVSLKRYIEGDTIRVYGAIREAEEPIIDAEVLRDVSL